MALSALANLTMLSLLLLSAAHATAASHSTPEAFLHCFLNHPLPFNTSSQLVYTPGTASYNAVLQSNAQNNRFVYSITTTKPVLIITPTTESQVQALVICGRKHGIQLRVRSGGHDFEGMSYASEGEPFIIVDLVNFQSVKVDADHSAVWVEAGATVGQLYYKVAETNKSATVPAGMCPTLGVGGHFSGGGIGTISRKYGTAADNIVDAWLVDADGRLLNRESMGEDLFWAIRGGGAASFGVVLAFKIKLIPVPPVVTAFNVTRNLRQNVTKILSRWQHIVADLDENLYIRPLVQAVDEAEGRTIQVIFQSVYVGPCQDLLSVMAKSFPELGFEAQDCIEMSWLESTLFMDAEYGTKGVDFLLDRTPQFNSSFKVKSDFVTRPFSEAEWEEIWKFLLDAEDEPLLMMMDPFGGRINEIPESAIPFPHRKGNLHLIEYFMRWFELDPAVTERHLDWMRKMYRFMTPYVSSNPRAAYYNFKDIDLGRTDGHTSYEKARIWGSKYFKDNFERLAYVKGQVDPDNYFRNEQSIPPLPTITSKTSTSVGMRSTQATQ